MEILCECLFYGGALFTEYFQIKEGLLFSPVNEGKQVERVCVSTCLSPCFQLEWGGGSKVMPFQQQVPPTPVGRDPLSGSNA